MKQSEVLVIGSGIGSLSAACLMAEAGKTVTVVEQNYLPGGCVSSYWRKGYVFDAGATTLVGLDSGQPLHYLLEKLKIALPARKLELPMQIRMKNGRIINRHQSIDAWIDEAKAEFGYENQEKFWRFCYKLSQFVWDTSLRQLTFPISSFGDLINAAIHATPAQVWNSRWSFYSMQDLLIDYGLHRNDDFVDFINAQLLITAQNTIENVNVLFGAASLCYTNYGNYYLDGGMITLTNKLAEYLKSKGGEIVYREAVEAITLEKDANSIGNSDKDMKYLVKTTKNEYQAGYIVSGLPINNTVSLFGNTLTSKYKKKIMPSSQLNSAFQMGIGFKRRKDYTTIHYQIHLQEYLPYIKAKTIFLSLSHPSDTSRTDDPTAMVASVSTHWPDPDKNIAFDKAILEEKIIEALVKQGFFNKEDILYYHSSTPEGWEKWTKREYGFVGGYPQTMAVKPWEMIDARLDGYKAYCVGDTVYPGQGIPGVALSGIIAFEKMKRDWF